MRNARVIALLLFSMVVASFSEAATELSVTPDKPFELDVTKLGKNETFVLETKDALLSLSVSAEGVVMISPLVGKMELAGQSKSGNNLGATLDTNTSVALWPASKLKLTAGKNGISLNLDFPSWVMTMRVDRAPDDGFMAKVDGLNQRLFAKHRLDTDRVDGQVRFRLGGRSFPGVLLGSKAKPANKDKDKKETKTEKRTKRIPELVKRSDGQNWQTTTMPELPWVVFKPQDVSP